MKTCKKCKEEKPLSNFSGMKCKSGLYYYSKCKECRRLEQLVFYYKNKELEKSKQVEKPDKIGLRLFIDRIERQKGYVDIIDAYKLTSIYIDFYGVKFFDKLSIEDELVYYYEKLKEINDKNTL